MELQINEGPSDDMLTYKSRYMEKLARNDFWSLDLDDRRLFWDFLGSGR